MSARHAIAALVILAAGAAPVCAPLAVFLGLCAVMVAIGWHWDRDRVADARRRAEPVKYFQAHRR